MKITRTSFISAASLIVGGLIGASALVALAQTSTWTAPTATPPGGNVAAPINVGGGGDPYTYSQIKTGLLGLSNLVVNNLQVLTSEGTTSTTTGKVLTAVDNNGTVEWRNGGSGSSGNTIVYINPVTLTTLSGSTVPWTTVSLASYGIPSNASAVILATTISAYNNLFVTKILMRANSSSPSYVLAATETSGGGAPSLSGFNQGIYPLSSSQSFDYSADSSLSGSTIILVGYVVGNTGGTNTVYVGGVTGITAGGNVSVTSTGPNGTGNVSINETPTQSTGTVVGGCYPTIAFSYLGTTPTSFSETAWGTGVTFNSGNGTCNCPSNYTSNIISNLTYKATSGGQPAPYPTFECLHN